MSPETTEALRAGRELFNARAFFEAHEVWEVAWRSEGAGPDKQLLQALILVAALSIAATAIPRLLNPQPIEQAGVGLGVSVLASAVNFGVARVLRRASQAYNSITL